MEYTKGTWTYYEPAIDPKRLVIISNLDETNFRSICRTFGYCDTIEEERANAERIVRAVNCHDDMYEALKHTQTMLYNLKVANLGELTQQQHLLEIEVVKALKKAEGHNA